MKHKRHISSLSGNRSTVPIIILWLGTIILLGYMIYYWSISESEYRNDKTLNRNSKKVFVDQLLLSPGELDLGELNSLINITLNMQRNDIKEPEISRALNEKRQVFNKILQQKINKLPKENSVGFTIKPIPK